MVKTTLFLAYKFIPSYKMNQQNNGITSSLNNNEEEKARQFRDQIFFWEAMVQIYIDAETAAEGSRFLDWFSKN
jgi:hypothetical protein